MYVDYSYYASCGGKMELDEFLVAEKAAEAYIRPVKSENNDGYSVTYASQSIEGESKEKLANRKMYEAARIHLLPTGWLNRKVGCGCGNEHDCYAL